MLFSSDSLNLGIKDRRPSPFLVSESADYAAAPATTCRGMGKKEVKEPAVMDDVRVTKSIMELSTKQLFTENVKDLLGGESDNTGVSSHKNSETCDKISKAGLTSKESMRKLQHDLEALLSRSAIVCPSFIRLHPLDLA